MITMGQKKKMLVKKKLLSADRSLGLTTSFQTLITMQRQATLNKALVI